MDIAYHPLPRPELFKYAPPCGEPGFLETVIERLEARTGVRRAMSDMVAVSGATAGIRDAIHALVDPGQEVVLPAPFWPLVRGIVWARGAIPVEVPFYTFLGNANFDPEQILEAAITDRTILIYLNTPHNPTGRVLSEEIIAAIAKVAARHDLWVLADEVYDEVYFTGSPPPATWSRHDLIERTVAVHSLSKSFAMAGARVGFAHGPADVMAAMRAVHTFVDFGPAKSQQLIASRVLREGNDWMTKTRSIYAKAAHMVSRRLNLNPIEGGTFAFVQAPLSCDDFLIRCADQGVLLTPGTVCGKDFGEWYRLSFTTIPPEAIERALSVIGSLA
jgi:N-succinyldiaminopimelate aminotransferase